MDKVMSTKAFFAKIETLARTLPWHEFVAEYVAAETATAEGRALVGGYKVWKVDGKYVWGLGRRVDGKLVFTPCFAPTDASTAYGWFERSRLKYFARKADDLRYDVLSAAAR